ncbi:HTH-type transcriptional regulator DmlR [Vibrio stylophorae]|uniref:HTH-type transcriptional regulator DmlR n=1 Tax=Vibrio stylophorae TaxID=659351 RepID=A0ABN8DX05_9VIBR|nr:LysR family transcriptional regulator [Vibrio stylophorae]CAH0535614.1 HTH-type transcriptional regulator DmlR [Vibrio stylophorae]
MKASLDDLHLFYQTVLHGGIGAAAQKNGLQRSKVSRRLQALEQQLACQLLIRTTRHIELTHEGQQLFDLIEGPLEHLVRGLSLIQSSQQENTGRVRLAIPSALMTSAALNSIITEYTTRFPQIQLEIENHQESVDLKRQAFDMQLLPSAAKISDDSYVQFSLLPYRCYFVASPDYLAQHAPIEQIDDLTTHRVFTNRYNAHLIEPILPIALKSDDLHLLTNLAKVGSGISFVPQIYSRPALSQGELVQVLSHYQHERQYLTLIYPSTRFLPQRVKVLISMFRDKFKDN